MSLIIVDERVINTEFIKCASPSYDGKSVFITFTDGDERQFHIKSIDFINALNSAIKEG